MRTKSNSNGQCSEWSSYAVIFVDDEIKILESVKRIFRQEPYQVFYASSGEEGLSLLAKKHRTAVIVSDQRMPCMNGSKFLGFTRELAPQAIRILLTGYSDSAATIAAVNEGGISRYLSKPWRDADLLQAVRDGVRQFHLLQENNRKQEIIFRQQENLKNLLAHLRQRNEELEGLASIDSLTGLTNRRCFMEAFELECQRSNRYGNPLALIMIDVDHFKQINDTLGHASGDAVLGEISREIRLAVRTVDLAGRYGGDEFVILLPETDLPEAALTAKRLQELLADTPVTLENDTLIQITLSIGVAALRPGEDTKALLERADLAMYQAKQKGRNRIELAEVPKAANGGSIQFRGI